MESCYRQLGNASVWRAVAYQADNQTSADVAEFVCAIGLQLAETLEEVFHSQEARDLSCNGDSAIVIPALLLH